MKVKLILRNFFKSFSIFMLSVMLVISGATPSFAKVKLPTGRDNEFAENNIVFYNPAGKKCYPKNKPAISSGDVLIIGDSITNASKTELGNKLPKATIIAQDSKQFGGSNSSNPTGIDILKEKGDSLPSIVVLALGTNNTGVSQESIDEAISLIGESRKLILTTNYKLNNASFYDANNNKFKAAATNHSNVGVADWAAAVKDNPTKYINSKDGYNVHPTNEGKVLFASIIASAVSAFGTPSPVGDTDIPDSGDNVSVTLGYLMSVGYSKEAAAAIVGNLINESGLNPKRFEDGVGNPGSTAGDDFRAINADGSKNFKGGFGIVQWTTLARVQKLQDYADNHSLPVVSLKAQLGFMVEELAGYNFAPSRLNAMSLEEATFYIFDQYETPGVSFWTTYKGTYYNDYDPTTLTGGSHPLSESKTPAAYKEYMERLNAAQSAIGITPSDDFPTDDDGSIDCPGGGDDDSGGGGGGGGGGGAPYDGDFPQYFQSDPRWGSLNYGSDGIHGHNGTSISASGCGPTSFAMMATALKKREILPDDTADVAGKAGMHCYNSTTGKWCGSYHSITSTLASHYGLSFKDFSVSSLSQAAQAINSALDQGYMIHTSGTGGAPFSTNGHYIGIYGRTSDGKWLVADSSSRGNGAYDQSTVLAGLNYDNLKGIK